MIDFLNITPETLIDCKAEAKRLALLELGEKPSAAAYTVDTISEYPRSIVVGLSAVLIAIVLGAWFMSATKVFHLAYHESLAALPGSTLIALVSGFVLVLLAELTVIGALIAKKVLFEQPIPANRFPQRVLNAVAWFATWIPISASIAVTQAHIKLARLTFENAFTTFFVALESLIPLVILGISLALEQMILKQIKERQHALRRFNEDMRAWNQAQLKVEATASYQEYLLREVYEAWLAANSQGRGRADRVARIQAMSDAELEALVRSQMKISPLARRAAAIQAPPSAADDTDQYKPIPEEVLEKAPLAGN